MDERFIKMTNNILCPCETEPRPMRNKYGLWIYHFCRGKSPGHAPASMPFRTFPFYNISHCYGARGWFCDKNGKIKAVEKGDVIILSPGVPHKYHGMEDGFYVEDAVSFGGPVADCLVNCGVMKNGVWKLGPSRKILPIIELVMENTRDSHIKANLALQNLLVEIYFLNKKPSGPAREQDRLFDELFMEIKNNPEKWWSVEMMAEYCNLGKIQFNRIFKKKTGTTPKNYIDRLKSQLAIETLVSEPVAVGELAARLGYLDPYHFSRRFKQLNGCSPDNYRKLYSRQPLA